MRIVPSVFTVIFLGLTNHAYALCQEGATGSCTINGEPGTRECIGGRFGPCVPSGRPGTPPVNGTARLKYYVLTVVYAPPGTQGGGSGSAVSYGSGSSTGTTTTTSHSFKQDYAISATAKGGILGNGLEVGVSFGYSRNNAHTDALDIKKTQSTTISSPGPAVDGVNHDRDMIWLWLNPAIDVSIAGQSVTWTFAGTSTADIQFVYVGWLKDPAKMPPGLVEVLQRNGVTPQDYPDILKADVFTACLPPPIQPAALVRGPRLRPEVPCITPSPLAPRFTSLNTTFPYEPPFAAGEPVPTLKFVLDDSTLSTSTATVQNEYTVGLTVEGSTDFISLWKTALKSSNSWTWANESTTATSAGSTQSASVTIAGPAFGYSGPTDMGVYYDNIYGTFVFAPVKVPLETLHGVISGRGGAPKAGEAVVAVAGGVKYRTYTNARGEYHFARSFSGPVELQAGAVRQRLQRMEPGKSFDFKL